MTISAIITRGYGTFAGVQYIPTRGYLPGVAPPIDSGGGYAGTKGKKTNKLLFEKYPDFEPNNGYEIEYLLLNH